MAIDFVDGLLRPVADVRKAISQPLQCSDFSPSITAAEIKLRLNIGRFFVWRSSCKRQV